MQKAGSLDNRLPIIDGLRGMGIFLVVWYHLWLQTWISSDFKFFGQDVNLGYIPATGYIGVEILLFITGFGLFYPYAQAIFEDRKLGSLSSFAYRRFIRIIPSYYLALFAAMFFFTVESANVKGEVLWQMFTHLTLIHIFFQGTQGAVSGLLWTIGTEAQFYLIFPILAYFFMRQPWLTFIGMVVCAYIFRMHGIGFEMDKIEMWTRQALAFFDIYACGMLAAYLLVYLRRFVHSNIWSKICFTLLSIASVLVFFNSLELLYKEDLAISMGRFVWLSENRLEIGLILLILIVSASYSVKIWQFVFNNRLALFLSVISYNLYLWHGMIILELKARAMPSWLGSDPHQDPNWQVSFVILATLASLFVAILTTFLIEIPLVKYGFNGLIKKISESLMKNYLILKASG